MAVTVSGRKIARFRCHIDPMVGPKPKQAFDVKDMKMQAEMTPAGIYINIPISIPGNALRWEEHVIPFANIQSIKLEPLPPESMKDEGAPSDVQGKQVKDSGAEAEGVIRIDSKKRGKA